MGENTALDNALPWSPLFEPWDGLGVQPIVYVGNGFRSLWRRRMFANKTVTTEQRDPLTTDVRDVSLVL